MDARPSRRPEQTSAAQINAKRSAATSRSLRAPKSACSARPSRAGDALERVGSGSYSARGDELVALLASMRAVREAIACTDRRRDVVAFGHVAAASTKPRAVIFLRQRHDEVVCIGNLRIQAFTARAMPDASRSASVRLALHACACTRSVRAGQELGRSQARQSPAEAADEDTQARPRQKSAVLCVCYSMLCSAALLRWACAVQCGVLERRPRRSATARRQSSARLRGLCDLLHRRAVQTAQAD